jgi:hypothetical protein
MLARLAFVTAVSTSSSVCSFFKRSSIFWLRLSIPNMIVRQCAFAMIGKSCMHVESTRPSQPDSIELSLSMSPWQIASMRLGAGGGSMG